jgi:hypothetical protein
MIRALLAAWQRYATRMWPRPQPEPLDLEPYAAVIVAADRAGRLLRADRLLGICTRELQKKLGVRGRLRFKPMAVKLDEDRHSGPYLLLSAEDHPELIHCRQCQLAKPHPTDQEHQDVWDAVSVFARRIASHDSYYDGPLDLGGIFYISPYSAVTVHYARSVLVVGGRVVFGREARRLRRKAAQMQELRLQASPQSM